CRKAQTKGAQIARPPDRRQDSRLARGRPPRPESRGTDGANHLRAQAWRNHAGAAPVLCMSFSGRLLPSARHRDRRSWIAGLALVGTYALVQMLDRREQPPARAVADPGHSGRLGWAGWKNVLYRTYQQILEDRLLALAGGVVFFGLLALFPAITALVS